MSTAAQNPAVSPSSLRVEHVEWNDPRAERLRAAMDAEMSIRYAGRDSGKTPEQEAELHRALSVDPAGVFVTVLISDADGVPVGHAALRDLRGDWEMKRVIVDSSRRGLGIGARLMAELDAAARAGGASRIILQTGDRQPEAVRLYERSGYTPIATYEPYITTIPFSICFEKTL